MLCVLLLQHLTFFRAVVPERVFLVQRRSRGTSAVLAGRIRSYVCGFFVLSFHGPADSCNHTDTDRNKRVRPVLPLLTPVPTCCRCHSGTHFRLSWCSPTRCLRFASLCSRLNRAVGPAFFAHQLLFLCVCCFCDVFSSMKTHVCFNARRTAYAHWLPCKYGAGASCAL